MKRISEKNINTPEYFDDMWNRSTYVNHYDKVRMRALIANVRNGDKVLDVGGGVFGSCQFISEETDLKCDMTVVDFSETAKQEIESKAPEIKVVMHDLETGIPFKTDEFDCVIAGEIIEHMENPQAFVNELCRIAKRVVTLSTVDTKCDKAKVLDYPEHIWEFTPDELLSFFPYGKYSVVGNYHFITCDLQPITITIDDFCDTNNKLGKLKELHEKTGMVFNLFTIVGECSPAFLSKVKEIPYIDMIPHGWVHTTPRECQTWDYDECIKYLDCLEPFGLTKGFKAPGWQISDPMYKALIERGYWVADQHYNDERRPDMRVHYPNSNHHFHIGHFNGGHNPNEIELMWDHLLSLHGNFKFIKDVI